MSIEEKAESWAVSMFDAMESNTHTRTRAFTAAGGALATIIIWVVHLLHPEIFNFFLNLNDWAKLLVGVVLAPPFVVAFTVGSFIYRQPEPEKTDISGPMSGYFYRERASRRWKLVVAAALITAVNFVLMLVTAAN